MTVSCWLGRFQSRRRNSRNDPRCRIENSPTPPKPATPSPAGPTDQPEDNRAKRGVDNEGDHSRPEVNTQLRQQPIPDERADTANYQVADEAVAAAPHDVAGKRSIDAWGFLLRDSVLGSLYA